MKRNNSLNLLSLSKSRASFSTGSPFRMTRRESAASTAYTYETSPCAYTASPAQATPEQLNPSFSRGVLRAPVRKMFLVTGRCPTKESGAVVRKTSKTGTRKSQQSQLSHSASDPQFTFASHYPYSEEMKSNIPHVSGLEETVAQKKEYKKNLRNTLFSMKKGCISEICKAEAAYNKARHYENQCNTNEYHKELRQNKRLKVCSEIVKIYPELDELQKELEVAKKNKRAQEIQVEEEEHRVALLRDHVIQLKRELVLQGKQNTILRDEVIKRSNKLGRKVQRIGLQEHQNDMTYYYYRRNVFKETHPKIFSPVLYCNRERDLSPNISNITHKRRASSGALFRHSHKVV